MYSVAWTVNSVQCTVHSAQCTVHSVQCTVNSVWCTVHSNRAQWTVFTSVQGCITHYNCYDDTVLDTTGQAWREEMPELWVSQNSKRRCRRARSLPHSYLPLSTAVYGRESDQWLIEFPCRLHALTITKIGTQQTNNHQDICYFVYGCFFQRISRFISRFFCDSVNIVKLKGSI